MPGSGRSPVGALVDQVCCAGLEFQALVGRQGKRFLRTMAHSRRGGGGGAAEENKREWANSERLPADEGQTLRWSESGAFFFFSIFFSPLGLWTSGAPPAAMVFFVFVFFFSSVFTFHLLLLVAKPCERRGRGNSLSLSLSLPPPVFLVGCPSLRASQPRCRTLL